jgi:tryptophan 7-halogenase
MRIERIVIAGGGVAGWTAASILARSFGPTGAAIQIVADDGVDISLGTESAVELILPATCAASAQLGYDEDLLIRSARAGFALGTALSGWGASSATAFLPFGAIGASMGPVAFHQLSTRLRAQGVAVNLANYSLAALCAQTGRMARPAPTDESVHRTLDYGLFIDTAAFAKAMKADSIDQGVTVTNRSVLRSVVDSDGLTTALVTDRGETISGDLFIDAMGPNSIFQKAFESWSHWLPCDRVVSALGRGDGNPLLFSHVEAHGGGWQSSAPLRDVMHETFVYSADALPDGPEATTFTSGRRTEPWRGNVIAIGGAAATIAPLTGTAFHLTLSALVRLTTLFPNSRFCQPEAIEYNRQTIEELESTRDYAILHCKGNRRVGEPFWDACRAMPVPDRLAHKIALYESCGRIALHDGETFEEPQWIALFDALGYRPRRYDALANGIERGRIDEHFSRIRDVMLKAVATMPLHNDYLQRLNR